MKQLITILTFLVLACTAFQGMISSLPISDPHTLTIVSAIALYLTLALTAWKQFASDLISNKSLVPTLIVAVAATVAGLGDLTAKLPLDAHTAQWIRFGITFTTMLINVSSSTLYAMPDLSAKKN